MKLLKKVLCPALAALLALSLAACGGSSSSVSLQSQTGEESSPSSASASESASQSASSGSSSMSSGSAAPSSSQSASQAASASAGDDGWELRLVSAAHPLSAELDITLDEVQGYKVDARMAPHLREMIQAAAADGLSLVVISGYRTFAKSAQLYENEVQAWVALGYGRADAETRAAARVAPAGTSEHHTGLAVDILSADYYSKHSDFEDSFEDDPEGRWLQQNCAEYGFILRYPKDKTALTGIDYEPWHFRYVGVENARAIMSQGLCLEEYVAG